jgi:hypothetical protein
MSLDVIGDLSNPTKDAAAIQPVLVTLETKTMIDLVGQVLPAVKEMLVNAANGLDITVTINISIAKKSV